MLKKKHSYFNPLHALVCFLVICVLDFRFRFKQTFSDFDSTFCPVLYIKFFCSVHLVSLCCKLRWPSGRPYAFVWQSVWRWSRWTTLTWSGGSFRDLVDCTEAMPAPLPGKSRSHSSSFLCGNSSRYVIKESTCCICSMKMYASCYDTISVQSSSLQCIRFFSTNRTTARRDDGGGSIGRALNSRFYDIGDPSSNPVRSTNIFCEFLQVKNVVLTHCRCGQCAEPLCMYARIRMTTYAR